MLLLVIKKIRWNGSYIKKVIFAFPIISIFCRNVLLLRHLVYVRFLNPLNNPYSFLFFCFVSKMFCNNLYSYINHFSISYWFFYIPFPISQIQNQSILFKLRNLFVMWGTFFVRHEKEILFFQIAKDFFHSLTQNVMKRLYHI